MKKTFLVVFAGDVESYEDIKITVVVLAKDENEALMIATIDANAEFDTQYDIDPDELSDSIDNGEVNTSIIEVTTSAVMIDIPGE
jgi:hypothetical protein